MYVIVCMYVIVGRCFVIVLYVCHCMYVIVVMQFPSGGIHFRRKRGKHSVRSATQKFVSVPELVIGAREMENIIGNGFPAGELDMKWQLNVIPAYLFNLGFYVWDVFFIRSMLCLNNFACLKPNYVPLCRMKIEIMETFLTPKQCCSNFEINRHVVVAVKL